MSKDQSSTPEAEFITSLTTADRRCSVANRRHHTGPYAHALSVCVRCGVSRILRGNKMRSCLNVTPSFLKRAHSFLVSYHMQYWAPQTLAQTLTMRHTGSGTRALSVVGWRTTQIWCCGSKKQGVICQCMDTLKGMCVHCLWGSQRFFCSRLFEGNLHSRKIDSLFFVPVSAVLQGRTLCLKGYY